MDGFQLRDKMGVQHFVCKELGISFLYKEQCSRFTFRVGEYYQLLPSCKAVVRWTMRNIHGLRFEDKAGDLPQEALPAVLKELCTIGVNESGRNVIAYKGGHFESDLLQAAGIQCYNLEELGCPKYRELLKMFDVLSAPSCGLHCYAYDHIAVHCPVAETMLFRKWLIGV